MKVDYHETSFLPPDLGLTKVELSNFSIKVSGAARAIMECLHLTPQKQELMECLELMEGLNTALAWKIQENDFARKLSTVRFLTQSFQRHLERLEQLRRKLHQGRKLR